jgi:hypothetical protein
MIRHWLAYARVRVWYWWRGYPYGRTALSDPDNVWMERVED